MTYKGSRNYLEIKRYLKNDWHKQAGIEYLPKDKAWLMPCGSLVDESDMIEFVDQCFDMWDAFEEIDKMVKISINRSKCVEVSE